MNLDFYSKLNHYNDGYINMNEFWKFDQVFLTFSSLCLKFLNIISIKVSVFSLKYLIVFVFSSLCSVKRHKNSKFHTVYRL